MECLGKTFCMNCSLVLHKCEVNGTIDLSKRNQSELFSIICIHFFFLELQAIELQNLQFCTSDCNCVNFGQKSTSEHGADFQSSLLSL